MEPHHTGRGSLLGLVLLCRTPVAPTPPLPTARSGMGPDQTGRVSRVAFVLLCRHAVATTPAGPSMGSGCSPEIDDGGLPHMSAGSAPASSVSRPIRRLLTLRPAGSRSRLTRPFPSKASAASLPPLPLRLLLAGATVA